MSSKFAIEYRDKIHSIPSKCGCIEVFIDDSHTKSNHERRKFYHRLDICKTVYEDLRENLTRVLAATLLWKDCKDIMVCISDRSLTKSKDVLEHVLVSICMKLGSNLELLNRKWIICHEASGIKQPILDAVEKLRKVYAGRLLALFPANVATPAMLCSKLAEVFTEIGANVHIADETVLQQEGFGLITGIGNSAINPPRMLIVNRPSKGRKSKHIGIVGKGVTFDSGGLAIKSFRHMHDMKFDKIGAIYSAMVLMYFLEHELYDDVEFTGVFPFVENAVSQNALRPGDVITSYSGKTVEVRNPDAEGRLILADAMSYIQEYDIDFLLDIATLTGHASDVSCWHAGMFFTRDSQFAADIEGWGERIGERVLAMPYWRDHAVELKSQVADIINSPKRCSDSTMAAMFLGEFVNPKLKWMHLDLAHETDDDLPQGHGIRIAIRVIQEICKKK